MRTGSGPAPFDVVLSDGTVLSAERRGSPGALPVVLLHAGVADRRSWAGVLDLLQDDGLDLVAVDRRGYGASPDPEPDRPFTHLADLLEVLDAVEAGPALLVGNSMGGGLAIDAALTEPRRVAALLLIGSAVSGMTDEGEEIEWTPDPATAALLQAIDAAERAGDVEEQVRLQLHLWLDGPTSPEGRVEEPARTLAAAMDRRIVAGGAGERGDSGVDAWHGLGDVGAPGLTVWGDLDVPADRPFLQLAADRLPTLESRVLPGVAHLPSLEQPRLVADLVREAAAAAGWRGPAR